LTSKVPEKKLDRIRSPLAGSILPRAVEFGMLFPTRFPHAKIPAVEYRAKKRSLSVALDALTSAVPAPGSRSTLVPVKKPVRVIFPVSSTKS
jgi:hypothetical protein